jgi:hypothetical protein
LIVQRNIIDHNWYSGIRFTGDNAGGIQITKNTFSANVAGSTGPGRAELSLDAAVDMTETLISANLFDVGNVLLNDCFGSPAGAFNFGDNFVHGGIPSGTMGNCVTAQTLGDPQLVDPAKGDFHAGNPAAAAYGAYSP